MNINRLRLKYLGWVTFDINHLNGKVISLHSFVSKNIKVYDMYCMATNFDHCTIYKRKEYHRVLKLITTGGFCHYENTQGIKIEFCNSELVKVFGEIPQEIFYELY